VFVVQKHRSHLLVSSKSGYYLGGKLEKSGVTVTLALPTPTKFWDEFESQRTIRPNHVMA
jgi:hypothetical protein